MTRESAKEILPVIQAWADGKPVQYRPRPDVATGEWRDLSPNDSLDFHAFEEYRVKPEPREFWIVPERCAVYASRENALLDWTAEKIIHVREVI